MRALFVIFSALLWVFSTSGAADAQTGVKYLDWPGKAHPNAIAPAAAVPTASAQAPQIAAPAPVAQPAMAVAAPPQTFTPKSIYDAPPPLAAPATVAATPAVALVASTTSERPRLYSLHRDYGEQPDRAVMPAPVYLDHLPVDVADKASKTGKEAKDDADASGDDDSDGGAAR
jgi:hypothetical protein